MMKMAGWFGLAALVLGAALGMPARAGEEVTAGRAIVAKWADTVVTVKLAAKVRITMGGEDQTQEHKSESTGTVLDATGLIVASLTQIDPSEAFARMGDDEETKGMKLSIDITDLKVRFADGLELPAKIVLRDKDLDLAFLRLVKPPAAPLTAVDSGTASAAGLLDQVIILSRMGSVANRTIAATVDRIEAVVEKPGKFFVPGGGGSPSLGCPVFGLDGKLVGIELLRVSPAAKGEERGQLLIVLPIADVDTAAKTAPKTADAPPK